LGTKKRPPVLRRASFHFDLEIVLSQGAPRPMMHDHMECSMVVMVAPGGEEH
jgi:hypothetical protein